MRSLRRSAPLALAVCALAFSGCSAGPTEKDIENAFQPLQSVSGAWTGAASTQGTSVVTFAFTLAQDAGGAVTGTGTMQEPNRAAVPIRITGSYRNQTLALLFTDMVYENVAVRGAFQSASPPVVGTSGPLQLTGTGSSYERTLNMTLIKQ